MADAGEYVAAHRVLHRVRHCQTGDERHQQTAGDRVDQAETGEMVKQKREQRAERAARRALNHARRAAAVDGVQQQLDENTGKIERVATLKEYRGQHYGAAAITAAEEWFAERGVKKIFINSRTEAVGFYEKLGYVADPKQITGTGAFQCIMTEKQL